MRATQRSSNSSVYGQSVTMNDARLPWRHFNSPLRLWHSMPYLLIFEAATYVAFGLCLSHALRKSRQSMSVILTAWIGGAITDYAFSILPNGNNFWHAQASLMFSSRVPLYVPCLYAIMLYLPHELMRCARLSRLGRAALGGLYAALMLNPYDNLSSTFLFTTWHDSDPALAERIAGNPAGNLLFCLGYGFSFHLLLGTGLPLASGAGAALFCAAVQLAAGNSSAAPRNSEVAIASVVLLLLVIASLVLRPTSLRRAPRFLTWRLSLAHGLLHGTLLGIAVFGDPERQTSTGLHQPIGPCDTMEVLPLSALRRGQFLCREDFKERFQFDCGVRPASDNPLWYTICGVPNKDYHAHVVSTAISFFVILMLEEILAFVRCEDDKKEADEKKQQ